MKKPIIVILVLLVSIYTVAAECVIPTNGMAITKNTILCEGTYTLPAGVKLEAKTDIIFDCNGATLRGKGENTGISVSWGGQHTIKNCNIKNYGTGIFMWVSNNNLIRSNNFINNYNVIYFDDADNVRVINNKFYHNTKGIYVYWDSTGIVIERNIVTENFDSGIAVSWDPSETLIRNNKIVGNNKGIEADCPYGHGTDNNYYENNVIKDNEYGIYLCQAYSSTVKGNLIKDNRNGIYVTGGSGNYIYQNNMVNNSIQAFDYGVASWNNNNDGNYWSDYDTPAEGCIDQNSDNICDSPYSNIPPFNRSDNLPHTIAFGT